jgi:hypothetical protein
MVSGICAAFLAEDRHDADAGALRQGEDQPPVVIGADGNHPLNIVGRHIDNPIISDLGDASPWEIFGRDGGW